MSNVEFITDEQRLRPDKSDVFRLWGDNSLITSLSGWKPIYDIGIGLEDTIEWITKSKNLRKYKAGIYNV